MPQYNVTARKTSPITPVVVDAETRELAIIQIVETAAEGEQIEVLQCIERPADAPPTGGASGASGAAMSAHHRK